MSGYYINICLSLFAIFARDIFGVRVETGLYSRVELTGEKLNQTATDCLQKVEWIKRNRSSQCLCLLFQKYNDTKIYSQCCGNAVFILNNNSLILENVTAQYEGDFMETIVSQNGSKKSFNFTLHILYPTNATEIMVIWTSNTSVTLRCEVTGSFLHIQWKREGVYIPKDHRYSIRNQTLNITNITSSDYGTYSCLVTNLFGESEKQTYITGHNSTLSQTNGTPAAPLSHNYQILISSGLTLIGVLGLCIMLVIIFKYHQGHCHRKTPDRKTKGDEDTDLGIYQEISSTQEVTLLPYVYTDFIKPKMSNQDSAAAEHFKEFGYSEIGQAGREETVILDCAIYEEQVTPSTDTLEE